MKYMGLDMGSKRIGIAVSDDFGWTAQPVATIHRKKKEDDFQKLMDLVDKYNITGIVVGLPKNMDGSIGKSAQRVLEFVELLKSNINIPVSLWDERMSTQAVTRTLIAADVRRDKRKKVVDKMAAAYILQGYLDFKEFQGDNV